MVIYFFRSMHTASTKYVRMTKLGKGVEVRAHYTTLLPQILIFQNHQNGKDTFPPTNKILFLKKLLFETDLKFLNQYFYLEYRASFQ